jgi:hypothetical protein
LRQSFFHNLISEIRQWCYPPEFRIESVTTGVDDEKINELIRSLSETLENLASLEFQSLMQAQTALDDEPFITDLATRLWRVRQCLRKPGTEEPVEGTDRGYRHLERLFSNLEQSGIRIVDKTGSFYDPGMAMTVVSSEPMDEIGREIIKETVKPAIFRGDRLIQTAQVVVGVPSTKRES